jgi:hypothetical protein
MITVLAIAAAYAGIRIAVVAVRSLRELPRRNEDMVLF